LLKDGRTRTIPGVLHIPGLAKNLIFVSRMGDARVQLVFKKVTFEMVGGTMVLMRGVWIGTLYKLLGSIVTNGSNNAVFEDEAEKISSLSVEMTMLWH